ncbi:extracellular solute-binding protein [Gracilibacillus salitolerans]|uniref:Extracellular solute-binding protein n=1 Tax=Gracilibacillus salitolerans TaxID=2663022 RepID=A0A5Q2TFU9_9BACI|nr:extracellular solute-binding protein [Gracilibacillus salitolerans]QGH33495.1 extracellular solute-binding protein [Gracilibacillus salitolerans]
MKKHLELWGLVTCLIGCFLIGCNPEESDNEELDTTNTQVETVYQHKGLNRYEEPIVLKIIGEISDNVRGLEDQFPGETLRDNRWTKLYNDMLGIEIQYEWIVESPFYYQRLANEIASGNLPDVVKVDAVQMRQLANAGLIQDLTTVFESYATPFTKYVMSQESIDPFEAARMDEKLMGIPEVISDLDTMQYIWIRTDWLENLDLDPPNTMEDLLVISKAFTHNDPDQNGEDDTYGLAVTNYLWNNIGGLTGFMAGFQAYPTTWLETKDGQLVYGGIQPEVKEALSVLQDMYHDGQIDSEFMFKDGNKIKEQVKNGEIGMLFGEQWASFFVEDSLNANLKADWQAFPIVSATGEPPKMPISHQVDYFWVVRADFEYPEALVKLINLHLEKNWGETADYEYYYSTPYPVWQFSPVTPYPVLKNLEAYRDLEYARQTGNNSNLYGEAKAIHERIEAYLNEGEKTGWGWYKTYSSDGAYSILDKFLKNDQILFDKFISPPTETMIEMDTILMNRQLDYYQNIILGNPTSEFDRFVNDWKEVGGNIMTEEINNIYRND